MTELTEVNIIKRWNTCALLLEQIKETEKVYIIDFKAENRPLKGPVRR